MALRRRGIVGLGLAYVGLSSWLALAGRPMLELEFARGGALFVHVWTESLVADLFFVAGTGYVGWIAWRTGTRYGTGASLLVGLVGSAFVYVASWAALDAFLPIGVRASGAPEIFEAGLTWSWMGLVFASLAPALAAARLSS